MSARQIPQPFHSVAKTHPSGPTEAETSPLISVVMCTFNGEKFLNEQLNSIEHQSLLPGEMIVCDDHSSDRTITLIEDFADRVEFPVRLVRNESRLGVGGNFSQAMALATGEFLAFTDQDDIWLPNRLERQLNLMRRYPTVGVNFGNAQIINESSVQTGDRLWEHVRFSTETERIRASEFLPVLLRHTVLTGATLMIRRELVAQINPVPSLWLHDAWIGLYACALGYDVVADQQSLIQYRVHADQDTGVRRKGPNYNRLLFERRPIDSTLAQFEEFANRVDELESKTDIVAELIQAKLNHLQRRRLASRQGVLRRTGIVAAEISRGAYNRYSNGWVSAIADLSGRNRVSP